MIDDMSGVLESILGQSVFPCACGPDSDSDSEQVLQEELREPAENKFKFGGTVKAGKLTTKTGEEMLQLDEQQLREALTAHVASTSSKKQMIAEAITNFKNYNNLVAAVNHPIPSNAVIIPDEDD